MKKLLLFLLLIPSLSNAITPIFTCGAEEGIDAIHWTLLGNGSFSTGTVKSGARSFRLNPSASSSRLTNTTAFGASSIYVVRCYVYFATLPNANVAIVTTGTSSASGNGVYFVSSDGTLRNGNGPSSVEASGASVTTGQWYRIDLLVNVSSVAISSQINGVGIATRNSLTAGTQTAISFGNNTTSVTADMFFDDILITQTAVDYPIGGGYVNQFVPTADGTHSGLTTSDFGRTLTGTDILNSTTDSYLLLDDVPMESGSSVDWINMLAPVASSYVENIFGPASGISTPTVAPRIASFIIGIHAAGTGAYNGEWLLNDNGTTTAIFTASAVAGSTTVIYKTLTLTDPPSAASSWTLSGNGNFNNLRVRFGPTASVDANPDVYFDCAMVEAEFAEVALTIPGTPSDKRHTTLGVGMLASNQSRIKIKMK